MSGCPPTSPIALFRAAVDALANQEIDNLTDRATGEDLVEMRRAMDRAEAEFARRLSHFEQRDGHAGDGFATPVAWLRSRCRMSAADAVQRLELGRRLPAIDGAEQAFRGGDITYRNATILARAVSDIGTDQIAPCASTLFSLAKTVDPYTLRTATRQARYIADPDGSLGDDERDHARRWLHLSQTYDGVFALDGLLDAEGGSLLRTALDALSKPTPDDDRNAGQRRVDALIELARRRLQAGDLPTTGGQRPHLVVTAPFATLRAEPGAPGGELDRGWPVHPETVRRIACDAAVTTIRIDATTGEPVSVERATRTVPASTRRALALRDRGCRFPGCDRPVEWTDAHHLRHRADGGETRLDNLVLLCRRCHRRVHEGRWRLRMERQGELVAAPP